jgi:two-component system, LuxR family, sensor kinase FixL
LNNNQHAYKVILTNSISNSIQGLDFKALFDSAADAMLLVNHTGHVLEANPAALELLEYTEEALLGLESEALVPDKLRRFHRQYLKAFNKNPKKRPMGSARKLLALSRSGKEIPVDVGLSLIQTHEQAYILITFYLAAKRREAEQVLRANEERLRLAKQAADLGVFELDPTRLVFHCDEKMLELWGVKGDKVISYADFIAAINPEDRAARQIELDRSFDPSSNGEYRVEYRITNPNDGIERWISTVGKTYFKNGRADRFLGVSKDITESKKILESLRKAHKQLIAFIQHAPLSMAMFDLNMNYIAYSKRWLTQYNRGHNNLTGRNHYEVHPDIPKQWKLIHKEVLAGAAFDDQEDEWKQSDGSTKWVRWSAQSWEDENAKIGGIIISTEDVTAQKMLEKQLLEQSEETKAIFQQQVAARTASAIAHELNQPLAAISAYSDVALRALSHPITSSPEKLKHALEGCIAQAQRAGRRLHELLAFLHEGELVTKAFDLNEMVIEALNVAKNEGYSEFHPKLHLEKDMPAVLANRIQVQKVLTNLIRNGVEAMRAEGLTDAEIVITVRTHKDMSMAHVTIKDKGSGINHDLAKRVFEPFFTTKSTGIGMGLAISRALVEAHGGQLWVEPSYKSGATFHFTLPFAP